MLCCKIPSGDLNVQAFADDIGLVIRRFHDNKHLLQIIFKFIALGAGLHLNTKKCVIVPLWNITPEALSLQLRESNDPWRDFQCSFSGRYLGIILGSHGDDASWNAATAKYVTRCAFI